MLLYNKYLLIQYNMSNNSEKIEVKLAKEWRIGPNIYPMTATVRGYCLLINNIKFDTIGERKGSEIDGNLLRQTFEQLGFNVVYEENLTAIGMHELLDLYSSEELASHDALAVIILSHGGDDGIICGTDYKKKVKKEGEKEEISGKISVREIIEKFNNTNCKSLRGKPKMFFLSCCRGGKFCYLFRKLILSFS